MIEKIILDRLSEKLAGSPPVYMETPENAPDSYVLIEKTGGGEIDRIESAMVAIQCYGPSLYEAAALNERVKNIMREITELDSVSACDLNSDYNFTDPDTKRYRYQAVYDIVYY